MDFEKKIYTVSKLTREIKSFFENKYSFLWIVGEISNYVVPSSGHSYFTLKDENSVINAIMFKNQRLSLNFVPENGMKVIGMGRLSLYEPRGTYQLVFEHLEPEGIGSLQLAFEQLKKELSKKGFFDEKHKKQIPLLPSKISVITSSSGAAVQDIIKVAKRRFSNCCLEIVPVQVQGTNAEPQIKDAIELVNKLDTSDLIILARGGGSLEDLSAFNTKSVAYAIFNSEIPIITGIGHETDFTIADFVSDLRAPTPSAAAEIALPDKSVLKQQIFDFQNRLTTSIKNKKFFFKQRLNDLISRLKTPRNFIDDKRLKIEDFNLRLSNTMSNILKNAKIKHQQLTIQLEILNPKAVLKRGYSITRLATDKKIIMNSKNIRTNEKIHVTLFKGVLRARVENTNET